MTLSLIIFIIIFAALLVGATAVTTLFKFILYLALIVVLAIGIQKLFK